MYVQKSFVLKPSEAEKKWHLIDANGKNVGRIATEIANLLRGKGKATFTPNTDSGDFVVVINAEKVNSIDSTGAGDTFIGYYLASIVKGMSIKDSLIRAGKAAAISTTKLGAAESIPKIN